MDARTADGPRRMRAHSLQRTAPARRTGWRASCSTAFMARSGLARGVDRLEEPPFAPAPGRLPPSMTHGRAKRRIPRWVADSAWGLLLSMGAPAGLLALRLLSGRAS